jgi:glucose/mannose-6-phosphate isomerase
MTDLDNAAEMARTDGHGMLDLVESFPEQCRRGWELGTSWAAGAGIGPPSSLVVAGMGGSAIAGDLVRGLLARDLPIPTAVTRDFEVPVWVGPDTLVICCSYSGNTRETISAFEHARGLGARVAAITSGGELLRRSSAAGSGPDPLIMPGGLPPRAALGYPLFGLLALVDSWKLTSTMSDDAAGAFASLDEAKARWGVEAPEDRNDAKALARELASALPIICAPEGPLGAVAFRWRTQLNENAKMVAYDCRFPELHHNEIVGLAGPINVKRPVVVLLRSRDECECLRARMEITRGLVERAGVRVVEFESSFEGSMASMVALAYLGDYVSVYTAVVRGVDPTPVEAIDALKKQSEEHCK